MKERIDITVPENIIELNGEKEERFNKIRNFEKTDRVPVDIDINQWGMLAARNITFNEYICSPENNLREQILNLKWKLETIRDDSIIPTEEICFEPDLGCIRGTEFEMEIVWPENQPPKMLHLLHDVEQIDDLKVPSPSKGLNKTYIQWYYAMQNKKSEFDVRLNGKPLKINITLQRLGGPIPSAFALAGSNLFLWMAMEPERVHQLMKIVTQSHLNCIAHFDELTGRKPEHAISMGADTAEMISEEMFKEFVVPYYLKVWEKYKGPRYYHNCGNNGHLLDSLRDDLKITCNHDFGFCVDPILLEEKMSGRILLSGGPDPMLIKTGTKEQIIEACQHYINILGKHSGFILKLGGGSAIGTPVENFHAMVEASKM